MAFWPGSEKDRQSRRAIISNDAGQYGGTLPQFVGKDKFPNGVGGQVYRDFPNPSFAVVSAQYRVAVRSADSGQYGGVLPQLVGKDAFYWEKGEVQADWPNPSFAVLTAQSRIARTATDTGQFDTPMPAFIGKDQFYDGAGYAPDFDWPNPSFAVIGRQALIAARATEFGQWTSLVPELIGPLQEFPNGAAVYDLAPRGPARATPDVYGIAAAFPQVLIAQDQFNAGLQSFELPAKAAARAPDYSFSAAFFHGLDGKDALPVGDALSGNAPLGAARASTLSEPGPNLTIALVSSVAAIPPGQSTLASELFPRAIARAREYGQTASFFHGLDGQDAFAAGSQLSGNAPRGVARSVDYSWLQAFALETIGPGQQFPVGAQVFDLATPPSPRSRDYTFAASFPLYLIGQDATAAGEQLSGNAPSGALRARDYSFVESFFHGLDGQDALTVGEQLSGNVPPPAARASTLGEPGVNLTLGLGAAAAPVGQSTLASDLPAKAPARAREYGYVAAFFHGLDGQDALAAGAQLSGNAPAAPRRAADYTFVASFPQELIAQDAFAPGAQISGNAPATAARARDYTWAQSFALETVGPQQQFPVGWQIYDLPTPAPRRAREYSFTGWYFLGLIGQDAVTAGDQLSGNAPAGPLRASTLSEPGVNQTVLLTAAPPVIPYGQSTAASEVYPRTSARAKEYGYVAAFFHGLDGKDALNTGLASLDAQYRIVPRARDYTFTAAFPLGLIGKDAFPNGVGGQVQGDWPLPPRAAPRSFAVYEPGVNAAILLPVPSIPVGEQIFDLPVPAPQRAREYSWLQSFSLGVYAQIPAGASTGLTENPPKGASRARDYSFTASFPLVLIGKDQFNTGQASLDGQYRATPRARDYTWLQTLPLHVYQQLPAGASTESSVNPPRGPARARDYSWLRALPIHLIGQDRLYGAPGEAPAYDWQLPPRAASRARDYTLAITAPYGSGIPPRDLEYALGQPHSKWSAGPSPLSHWSAGNLPPSTHWTTGSPRQ